MRAGERIKAIREARKMSMNILAKRAGIGKRVSAHALRHTCATHLIEGGAPITAVKEILGHATLRSTEIYLHVSREHVRGHYFAAHPLAREESVKEA